MERIITLSIKALTETDLLATLEDIRSSVQDINAQPRKALVEILDAPGSGDDRIDTLLTPRERQIVDHIAKGTSSKVIAHQLGLTEATVKIHLRNAYRKTGTVNRTQLAMWAARRRPVLLLEPA